MSFESEKPFNDFQHFARGLRRSGDFTINESNLLEKCGTAMMELYNGTREPSNDEEKEFVKQITSDEVITDKNAKIFKKYLQVIQPAADRTHKGLFRHTPCQRTRREEAPLLVGGKL